MIKNLSFRVVGMNQPIEVRGSMNFIPGRLYQCVKTSEIYPAWFNCIAWVQLKDCPILDLQKGRVYALVQDPITGGYDLNRGQKDGGLNFLDCYTFELLPENTKIQVHYTLTLTSQVTGLLENI